MEQPTFWAKCSSCKKEISFRQRYYLCSVSTCRQKRTCLHFCSVPCWDAHLGVANHRSGTFAEEAIAPSLEEHLRELAEADETPRPVKRMIIEEKPSTPSPTNVKVDTLVVVSRVKALISELSAFNTSQCCIDALTKKIVDECRKGIERAKAAGRKTVMGRDIVP